MNILTAAKLTSLLAISAVLCAAAWAEVDAGPAPEGVLLLRNGEVIAGKILQQGDRFHVQLAGAKIRVRVKEVELICRTVEEGYQRKLAAIRTPKASDHLALAEWCTRQRLFEHARQELAKAAGLEPLHPQLHRVQQRLEQASSVSAAPRAAPVENTLYQANHELDRFVRALPDKSVEAYTRTIQPLLMNSCSAVACHGPQAKTSFTLVKAPSGKQISRRLTQRNLQQTMKLVRRDQPLSSPLLTVPLEPHGTCTTPLFRKEQHGTYWQLAEWIARISEDDAGAKTATVGERGDPLLQTMRDLPTAPAAIPTAVRMAELDPDSTAPSFDLPEDVAAEKPTKPQSAGRLPAAQAALGAEAAPARRTEAAAAGYTAVDPFDPEIFNRRYSGD